MPRLPRLLTLAALTVALAVLPSGSAVGASYKNCSVKGKERKLGATYVGKVVDRDTIIRVRGTSCSAAQDVIKAFHACRYKKGKSGRCTTKVKGYRCTENRPAALKGPTSYDSDASCANGDRRVKHHYQQNT